MTVVSIRFSDEPLHQRVKASAHQPNVGLSTLSVGLVVPRSAAQSRPHLGRNDDEDTEDQWYQ